MPECLGIDFDNTLACYDTVLARLAAEHGLHAVGKRAIRDAFRTLPEGDVAWQRVQAEIYGPRIHEAEPFPGVLDFLKQARNRGLPVVVVSHKTRTAPYGDSAVDLRTQALAWLEARGLLNPSVTGLSTEHIHFAGTRAEKLALIRFCGCTTFVDDLEETFQESDFPTGVARLLFDPEGSATGGGWDKAFTSWDALGAYLLGRP